MGPVHQYRYLQVDMEGAITGCRKLWLQMWNYGTVVIQYEEVGPGGVELKYGSMVNVF